jgi:tRNA A37 methylthiotransferase MiaB
VARQLGCANVQLVKVHCGAEHRCEYFIIPTKRGVDESIQHIRDNSAMTVFQRVFSIRDEKR